MTHFAIGSHLKVARLGYSHHGVYLGNGMVIHYAGLCEGLKSAPVEMTTLAVFQGKAKKVEVVSYAGIKCFSPDEIIKRAMSRLGEINTILSPTTASILPVGVLQGLQKASKSKKR